MKRLPAPGAGSVLVALVLSAACSCDSSRRGQIGPRTIPASTIPSVRGLVVPMKVELRPKKLYTQHLGRLTNTALNPSAQVGVDGTDLGISYPGADRVHFLFGDTRPTTRSEDAAKDSSAWAPLAVPANDALPHLTWEVAPINPVNNAPFYVSREGDPTSRFLPLEVSRPSRIQFLGFETPTDAFEYDGKTYVFFAHDWHGCPSGSDRSCVEFHRRSLLAHFTGAAVSDMTLDHDVSSTKFLNISAVVDGATVYLFGSGIYRRSDVYLARVPIGSIGDRLRWMYYSGPNPDGTPRWSSGELSAVALIGQSRMDNQPGNVGDSTVGELSVRAYSPLGGYVMAYQGLEDGERGVWLRRATTPVGPWTRPLNMFDVRYDNGYTHFMHSKDSAPKVGYDDGLAERGNEESWGGEYGPYLIPQWFSSGGGTHTIYYTLSSWVPYQVHLMKTVVVDLLATPPPLPPIPGLGLPLMVVENGDFSQELAGWSRSGDTPIFIDDAGTRLLSSKGRLDPNTPRLQVWQDLTVDATNTILEFWIQGSAGSVKLLRHGAEVVRETRPESRSTLARHARWNLEELRGQRVRLLIEDDSNLGYVEVRGFVAHPR